MSDQQPPSETGGDPGSSGGADPSAPTPPSPPPYGQAGASWPNSQPLPPTHSVPGQPPPAYDPNQPYPPQDPSVGAGAAGLPYGAGQPPPGPPGSHPYGGPGGYGGPYIPPIPKQSSAGKIVAIVIGLVLLLVCGGCFAVGVVAWDVGQDAIQEIENYEPPADETVTALPGEPFLVGDFSVAGGWSVGVTGGVLGVEDMTIRKVGDAGFDTAAFVMTFFRGDRVLGEATCSGTVTEQGGQADVSCLVSDRKVRRADRVEVQALI